MSKAMEGKRGDGGLFSTETEGLADAAKPSVVRLRDGDHFDLQIYPVRKRVGDAMLRMLSYNGSIPGPTSARRSGIGDHGAGDE